MHLCPVHHFPTPKQQLEHLCQTQCARLHLRLLYILRYRHWDDVSCIQPDLLPKCLGIHVDLNSLWVYHSRIGSTVTIYQPPSTVSGSDRTIVATQSASTITIYQQATSAQPSDGSQPTGNAMVSDNSFENGTSSPFNTSASVPSIWAEVVQSGPYQPRSGDSYLCVQLLVPRF